MESKNTKAPSVTKLDWEVMNFSPLAGQAGHISNGRLYPDLCSFAIIFRFGEDKYKAVFEVDLDKNKI